jgi:hypothetical protein
MYINTFGQGERPDDLIIIHDGAGDGSVKLVPNGVNSYILQIATNADDKPYFFRDLIINGKRGDTSELPIGFGNGLPNVILPSIVISPYDEIPAENRGAKATYYQGIREGKSGPLDLIIMAENWLTNGSGPENYWANGADWNTDGEVNLKDFALMSSNGDEANYLNE